MPDETPRIPAQRDLATLEAGLDALETARSTRAEPLRRLLRILLPPLLAAAALLGLWNLLVLARIKPGWVLPGPGDVYDALVADWTRYGIGDALLGSISRAVIGFGASVLLGTLIGLAAAGSRTLRSAVAPLLSGLQNLPSVAWVPIAIMWFGITPATIYTVMLLGAVPSVVIGLIDGIDQVPPIYRKVGGNLGARGLVLVRRVLLPAALPAYVSGLKQGWAFSWRSLMAAELIAVSPTLGPGIGQTLELARENQDMALAFATVLLILGLGVLVNVLGFAPVERGLRHRRGLERA
ncbi:ABC transporter permease [Actinospica sp. MGRD01-02]|uniref:ABC transporter permease n=1 Tax=Actinospica acidithermotolerans TaxID=2828514 RepID=A0A941EFC7_9ACTN|nr:ABC transporter permease [Actinospica acidithermotolerans]MBR7830431.1 ABC transporter permease [Actinospica acidithermotolerans]